MGEREAGLSLAVLGGGDEVGPLRLVHRVQEGIGVGLSQGFHQVEAEGAADDGGGAEHTAALLADALKPTPDDQADAPWE